MVAGISTDKIIYGIHEGLSDRLGSTGIGSTLFPEALMSQLHSRVPGINGCSGREYRLAKRELMRTEISSQIGCSVARSED